MKRALAVVLGVVVAGVAWADEIVELRPMEVRTPVTDADETTRFGGSVAVVGREQILDLNARGMADALRRVTGVNISRYNNVGSYGGADGGAFYIRGQGVSRPGSEIRIYVDGAPREVGVWNHSLLDIVNVAHAQNLKVYKSPQPQMFGGVFGAVEMETLRRDDPGFETGLSLSAGSHSTYAGDIAHGGKQDGLDYYAGYSYAESDGHRDHSAGSLESAFARLGYELNRDLHAAYIFNTTDNYAEDPGRKDEPTPKRDRYNTRSYDHVVRLDHNGNNGEGYLLGYYEDGDANWQKDHLNGPKTPAGNSDTHWENYGMRSSHTLDWEMWEFTGGLDWMSSGGDFENVTTFGKKVFGYSDRFTTLSPAVAALCNLPIGNNVGQLFTLRPSAGVRWYENSEFDNEFAPQAGLIAENNRWSLHFSYSRGVHYPGVYAAGTSASTLDEMSAEKMDHYEAGISLEPLDVLRLTLTGFQDESTDLLVSTPDGMINAGDGTVKGVECGVDYLPFDWTRLYVGTTFLDTSPSDYPRTPDSSVVGAANILPADRWEIGFDAEYVSSQTVGNRRAPAAGWSQFEEVDSYLLCNAKVNYDLLQRENRLVRLFAAVENLTDEDYEYWPGYPMPGTSFTFGAESRF